MTAPIADRHGPDRDFTGYGRGGAGVRWPNGARIAVCLIVNFESGAEASYWAGDGRNEPPQEFGYPPPPIRDLGNESIFEYGSRTGVWRLQRLFDAYGLRVTFHGCARAFELVPEVGAYIAEAGHEVCAHGWRWEEVSRLARDVEREHIAWTVESIRRTCGHRPVGWYSRCPASLNTRELLVEEGGFRYDSDSFADDVPYFTRVGQTRHLVVPYSFVTNDSLFHPGQAYSSPSDFLDSCRRTFDLLWEEGAQRPQMMSVGIHPRLIGQPGRAHALREFLDHCLAHDGVWFTRKADIAEWFHEHAGEFGRTGEFA
ncbi:polysaccharide deacetylase family protein [Nocardia sp. BMG51109]|uniref:polysaccharide deacetylase family protein n=1 Tax=Nocardia sp. BMG51109 TaxID=1056816 RepID=UPI0004649DB8|nr:polysaccharide deacetylase family protein [Nocardia sp. BMG51109]